jgi:aminopeptidase-like protein
MLVLPFSAALLLFTSVLSRIDAARNKVKQHGYQRINFSEKSLRIRCWKPVLVIAFLCYPSICKTVFTMFKCDAIGGSRYLHADLSVDCSSFYYKYYFSCACIGAVVYVRAGHSCGDVFCSVLEHRDDPKITRRSG